MAGACHDVTDLIGNEQVRVRRWMERGRRTPWLAAAAKLECPVGRPVQLWIESSLGWFEAEFGREPLLRDIVLPRTAAVRCAVC